MRRSITVLMAAAACAVWAAGPASADTGTTWAIQSTASPSGASAPSFAGVSCPSATNCIAVGSDSNTQTTISQTLAEQWNGSTWTVQPTVSLPGSLNAQLAGVSCVSVTNCIAVGDNTSSSDLGTVLAEHWNGSTWTNQNAPSPADADEGSSLLGISCSSATSCMAVGSQNSSDDDNQEALAEHWNGSTWTIEAVPVPSGAAGIELFGVSCSSDTSCMAVGAVTNTTSYLTLVAEHWDGSTWTVQDTPNPNGAGASRESISALSGVSCSTDTSCTAVGFADPGSGDDEEPLAEQWDGSTWTIESTPSPAGTGTDPLNSVSCVSPADCTATGGASVGGTSFSTMAEQWNGSTWALQSTPNPSDSTNSIFAGVSCVSAATCIAVGSSWDGALAEQS